VPVDIPDNPILYTRKPDTLYPKTRYFIPDNPTIVDTVDGSVNKPCG